MENREMYEIVEIQIVKLEIEDILSTSNDGNFNGTPEPFKLF